MDPSTKGTAGMTDFERQVIETLTRLETIITDDHKILRGNGHPGIVDRVAALESRLGEIQNVGETIKMFVDLKTDVMLLKQGKAWWHGVVVDGLAIICALVSIYCAFFK